MKARCCGAGVVDGLRRLMSSRTGVSSTGNARKYIKHSNEETAFFDCLSDDEEAQQAASQERERLFEAVATSFGEQVGAADDDDMAAVAERFRFYTAGELDQILDYRRTISRCSTMHVQRQQSKSSATRIVEGDAEHGYETIDATSFKVRGPNYLKDRMKVQSAGSSAELVVVDVYKVTRDVSRVAQDEEAGVIRRLRKNGEKRRLLILNFRLAPLQMVAVWALPAVGDENGSFGGADGAPARKLISRFLDDMDDAERRKRLKFVPRVVEGPFLVRKFIGETPAIIARPVPTDFYADGNEFEISLAISASRVAQRAISIACPAAGALVLEFALIVEGTAEDELPEAVLGGFRVNKVDMRRLREV